MNLVAELIVETVRTPLVLIDRQFLVKTANPAFCATFQTSLSEAVGLPLFADGDSHWDLPSLRAALERVLQTGDQLLESEIEHRVSDTDWKVFLVSCIRIEKTAGRDALLLLTFDDITERKKLANALAWHSAELKRSNLELEHFAYVASHDLQEPLRKIRTYGDLLRTETAEKLTESCDDFLRRMVNAAERMQILINDLLAYSRVASRPPALKLIDLDKIVAEVLGDLDAVVAEARAKITVAELPEIEADPMQMRQVFQNLIGNALKFRRPGELVAVEIDSSPIAQGTEGADSGSGNAVFRFRVSDNGIGFDAQYADTIFAPFQRLHSRKAYAGTGIGLAICRRIIERHGGSISAHGNPAGGATFEFVLPHRQLQHRRAP